MCRISGNEIPPILACLIYRPPKIPFDVNPDFLNNLRDLCSYILYSHKVLMGDFNADLLNKNTDSKFIRSLTSELSLQIINHRATHRPPGSFDMRTWIDIICVDDNDKILSYNNKIPLFRSRHNLIDVEIELFIPKPPCESFT